MFTRFNDMIVYRLLLFILGFYWIPTRYMKPFHPRTAYDSFDSIIHCFCMDMKENPSSSLFLSSTLAQKNFIYFLIVFLSVFLHPHQEVTSNLEILLFVITLLIWKYFTWH